VDLQERLDLRYPAVAHEGDMVGGIVVAVIGGLVGELHREAETVVVLRADLAEPLELLHAGDFGEDQRGVEERLLGLRMRRMLQPERYRVPDHPKPRLSKKPAMFRASRCQAGDGFFARRSRTSLSAAR